MEISGNAFSAGLGGIQAGQRRVEQAASEIAGNAVAAAQDRPAQQAAPGADAQAASSADLATSLVGLAQGRNEVQASARVVETADEVLGTLIDTRV